MNVLDRIYREPAALIAFATATLAVLTGTGVLTQTGATIALGVVAAAVGLLRYVVTPSSEVVAQEKPSGEVVAGAASWVVDGHPVDVAVTPIDTSLDPPDERGAVSWVYVVSTILGAMAVTLLVLILVR